MGRYGNNLFQKACCIGYAIKHNLPFDVSKSVETADIVLKEKAFNYEELPFKEEWRGKSILITGYRQSWKYFDHCKEEVIKSFNINPVRKIGWIALHQRRGDYLTKQDCHPVTTKEYRDKAILYCRRLGYDNFIIFGDDQDWNLENINEREYPGCNFEYSEGRTAAEDMELASGCNGVIGSNSSYSLWIYYLNPNENKIGVFPKRWFGDRLPHNTNDLYPEGVIIF